MNTTNSWTSPLAESTTIASTYGTSDQQVYYFGAYPRNMNAAQPPSLTCGNRYSQIDRSTVDLYRYVSGSTGVSNQLKYPVALLTADEVSFAGSGRGTATQGSAYHYNPYLRSGSNFWLLSPYYRTSSGRANGFVLTSDGDLYPLEANVTVGVRPAISLTSGTLATSGTGTAADPWVVLPPPAMQDFTASECKAKASDGNFTVYDRRDSSAYTVRYINGNCWMTQNLRITGTINATDSNFTTSPYSGTTSINVSAGGDLRGSNSTYTAPQAHLANATDVANANYYNANNYTATDLGAWYNFCAASAGEVCQSSTKQNATQDICPAGWRLPTNSEQSGITSYTSSFSPVCGGLYEDGGWLISATEYGFWWSATADKTRSQYFLLYYNGSLRTNSENKYYGPNVRCIRSS